MKPTPANLDRCQRNLDAREPPGYWTDNPAEDDAYADEIWEDEMDGIVGLFNWDACDNCIHYLQAHGCAAPNPPVYTCGGDDAVVCNEFLKVVL